MSKNIKTNIIRKIESQEIKMKPAWMFYLGTTISIVGLFFTTILTLLSIQLLKFRLTHPGLSAEKKISLVIATLPWYIPVLAVSGLIGGYYLLKRYDFSYSRNRAVVFGLIVLALFLGSLALNRLGIDEFLGRRGYFKQIYSQMGPSSPSQRPGRGAGYGKLK